MLRADPRTFDSSRKPASSRASEAGPCRIGAPPGCTGMSDLMSRATGLRSDGPWEILGVGLLHDLDRGSFFTGSGTPGTTSVAS